MTDSDEVESVPWDLDECVLECAALARRIAPERCRKDPETGKDCSWYHGFWPYLRALGIVTTPTTHGEFYAEVLGSLARDNSNRRVLISGSSDFTMLQHVYSAFDAAGTDPEVTFCDICHTPVDLARWYADRVSKSLETQASDILTLEAPKPYDIICTHSFLGYFSDAARKSLALKWHELLRPGGKVVTINRVRPDHEGDVVRFSAGQARAFQGKARAEVEKHRQDLDISPEELARGLDRYVRHFQVHPLRSLGDLESLFQDNGFDVDRLDVKSVPGNKNRPSAGPTTPEGANYAHLVATRQ